MATQFEKRIDWGYGNAGRTDGILPVAARNRADKSPAQTKHYPNPIPSPDHRADPNDVGSVRAGAVADAVAGRVEWDPVHSLWNGTMLVLTLGVAPFVVSPGALLVFLLTTGITLLAGHSVGFHRLMIHRSFKTPRPVEYCLIWLGTLVGMSGPFWMMRAHDLRDWAQRQPDCHAYLAHKNGMLRDYWWQLHCRLKLDAPPDHDLGRIGRDPFYRFLERSWMVQQIPLALLLYAGGGIGWVIWGIAVRVCVSVTGHWFIGHLAHNRGPQRWIVEASGVQAFDVPWAAMPSMGESWHNNHHAFPGSARIGLYRGQSDWGYAFIRLLAHLGLASAIRLPADMPARYDALRPVPATGIPHLY